MTAIFSLVRQLVLVAVFASFCELLLPSGKFRSFIRFSVGLAMIALMLQPLARLGGLTIDPQALLTSGESAGLNLRGKNWVQAQSQELVEGALAGQIEDFLALEYPDCRVSVRLEVTFNQYGLLQDFNGMKVEVYPAAGRIEKVRPVLLGAENPVGKGGAPPGLAGDLARQLGVPTAKLNLWVAEEGTENE